MGVAVTCPKCNISFAFSCNKCSSYDITINKGFEPEKYFQTRTVFYLKCKKCQSEYDYAICPDCSAKVFPNAPFVKGDSEGEKVKGCFIATACLDGNRHILRQLCLFRDELLGKNQTGKKFIEYYYIYSPVLASRIQSNNLLKSVIKFLIVYPAYYASILAMKIISVYKK